MGRLFLRLLCEVIQFGLQVLLKLSNGFELCLGSSHLLTPALDLYVHLTFELSDHTLELRLGLLPEFLPITSAQLTNWLARGLLFAFEFATSLLELLQDGAGALPHLHFEFCQDRIGLAIGAKCGGVRLALRALRKTQTRDDGQFWSFRFDDGEGPR